MSKLVLVISGWKKPARNMKKIIMYAYLKPPIRRVPFSSAIVRLVLS